ncbi:hypothetical protein F5141DRAFT_1124888, partial [Pisolithus sp. B1]
MHKRESASKASCILISQFVSPSMLCTLANVSRSSVRSASASASGSSDSGRSPSVLAGSIAAVLLTLVGALLVFFLYRRRQRAPRTGDAGLPSKPNVPAPAAAVLNHPDPIEKSPSKPEAERPQSPIASVIDVSPQSVHVSRTIESPPTPGRHPSANPFDDVQSIQTVTTHTNSTNVIPIALASSDSTSGVPRSESGISSQSSPVRPARPSELSLDGSQAVESLREPSPRYAQSQRSGSSHMSCMSGASYSSEFLNEAPMIVTQGQGAVRQVLGKVKAEVIQTSGASTPTSMDTLKPPSTVSRPSFRSPLAATSFGPADVVEEAEEDNEANRSDPFDDHHRSVSRAPSEISNKSQPASELSLEVPNLLLARKDRSSRPDSLSTQAGSIIDIGSATRVNVGLADKLDQKSPYRTAMGKLVSPRSVPPAGQSSSIEQQQQMALAHAQAQARAHGLEKARRVSGNSVVSTTSTRADSILESFPFVPPSPIASRPVRSPPRSPLCQQASSATIQLNVQTPLPPGALEAHESSLPPLTPPQSRRMLGMSTASELSTASSGLGNFTFHIDNGVAEGNVSSPNLQERQRASLDTLVLISDLSSYPLGYDSDEHKSLPLPKIR